MKEIAFAAYNQAIPGIEPGLEAVSYYDPPNMTYPFGAYICVMEIDVDTGEHEIRQFYALDDCGTRINPMIIEGQVHGGLTEALAIAMGQEIAYDNMGNVKTGTLMDFFLPTAWETPNYTTDHTTTPSPHHPIGAKGVGESPMLVVFQHFQMRCMMLLEHLAFVKCICLTIIGVSGKQLMILDCTANKIK